MIPLEHVEPEIERCELGSLLLWRDDLADIVGLTGQLDGTARIVADNCLVTDLDAILPRIGPRVEYFTVTVTGTDENAIKRDLLNLRLSRHQSYVEAAEPDLRTRGVIGDIRSLAMRHQRLPGWLMAFAGVGSSSIWAILALLIIVSAVVIDLLAGKSVLTPLQWGISGFITSIAGIALGALLITALAMSSTVLFTGIRAEAPTWWQRQRAVIAISFAVSFAVGLLFFLLSLVVPHL
jgi:hypothetical protein